MINIHIGKDNLYMPRNSTHLYLNGFCIGYLDAMPGRRFMISLNTQFGEDSEVCTGGKKDCAKRLFEIYQMATKN